MKTRADIKDLIEKLKRSNSLLATENEVDEVVLTVSEYIAGRLNSLMENRN